MSASTSKAHSCAIECAKIAWPGDGWRSHYDETATMARVIESFFGRDDLLKHFSLREAIAEKMREVQHTDAVGTTGGKITISTVFKTEKPNP